MIDRSTIKAKAKHGLKRYYWMAVVATLIMTVIQGGVFNSSSGNNSRNYMTFNYDSFQTDYDFSGALDQLVSSITGLPLFLVAVGSIFTLLFILLATYAFTIFVRNVIAVGYASYFIKNRDSDVGVGELFAFFKGGTYKNTVLTIFLMDLFVALWTLLLVIPGIIKAYEYYFVKYIIAENPELDWREALQLSKNMTDGRKGELFVFDLSFILWSLASALVPFGFGRFFLHPYIQASKAELYESLKPSVSVENDGYYA